MEAEEAERPQNESMSSFFDGDEEDCNLIRRLTDAKSEDYAISQEDDEGNIEYKLKLVNPGPERLEHLLTQMRFRLEEGQGEAVYELGVEDDGSITGLNDDDLTASIKTINTLAERADATANIILKRKGTRGHAVEILVRSKPRAGLDHTDVRVAVAGNVDSGKSTLIGVLTRGGLDNGRGSARVSVFKHKHEVENGRTSAVSHQIMGFDSGGEVVNYCSYRTPNWVEICDESSKVVSFIDLAGHEKYLKTTVFGMTGQVPDYCLVAVGANMGLTKMTKEHMGIAIALKIPIFVVVSKIDIAPPNVLQATMDTLNKILKSPGARKLPYLVKDDDNVVHAAKNISNDRLTPIFQVSSVTGKGLDQVRKFLNLVPGKKWNDVMDEAPEFMIDDTYYVTGVGTVVGGTMISGSIAAGQTLMMGPDGNGAFKPVTVKSIQSKRVAVKTIQAGQSASFALKKVKRAHIRKGMMIVDPARAKAVREFEAEIVILHHPTTMCLNYQPVVHCMCIRQAAKIIEMSIETLRTGDKATVRFRFMFRPEFVKPGARLIFREGRTKGIGKVTKVFFTDDDHASTSGSAPIAAPCSGSGPEVINNPQVGVCG